MSNTTGAGNESVSFSQRFEVRWADLDPNRHLRHTAFMDYATHVRFAYLAEHGFPAQRFAEEGFGPVIFREETVYRSEVSPQHSIEVDFMIGKLAPDSSRFRLVHHIERDDGVRAAVVTVDGAWFSLDTRKLIVPPAKLNELLHQLPRTADFERLPARSEKAD